MNSSRLESHRLALVLVGIVLPEELDLIAFDGDQPVVADRHTVGVGARYFST